MTAREELAAVLESQLNDEYGDEGWRELGSLRRITDALLASPALASLIREKQAEAWDEGRDTTTPYATNPYRADQVEGSGDCGKCYREMVDGCLGQCTYRADQTETEEH